MDQENRRSFVKKSLATSVSISFAGLIKAHGEEGGGTTTTWIPDGTTYLNTTWNPNATTYVTTNSGATTTWNPDQTTVDSTTSSTTADTTPKLFQMKCASPSPVGPTSTTYTFGLIGQNYDSDPVGFKNFGTAENPSWYRIFTQEIVVVDVVTDNGWYGQKTVNFTCKGRYSYVPCSGETDLVSPPSDTSTAGNGVNGWTSWATWTRQVSVTCAESDGKITKAKGSGDTEQSSDTGTDGSKIETDMAVGEGGSATCKFKYKPPYGGSGDEIIATVEFVSENRYGKES